MPNYSIVKLEYISGLAEENKPPRAQLVETFPAHHPSLASARATLNQIAETYPATEIEFWGADLLWVSFSWPTDAAYKAYGLRHIRSHVSFWIEEED